MLLVGNSCLSTLMFGIAMIIVTSLTLEKDIKQIKYYTIRPFCWPFSVDSKQWFWGGLGLFAGN